MNFRGQIKSSAFVECDTFKSILCVITPQDKKIYGLQNIQFALTFLQRACKGNISGVYKENLSPTKVHTHHDGLSFICN